MWGFKWAHGTNHYSMVISRRELEALQKLVCGSAANKLVLLRLHDDLSDLLTLDRVPAPDQPGGKPHV